MAADGINQTINTVTLRDWLETNHPVNILDVRPTEERLEWYIPGSLYFNVYDKLKTNDPNALKGLYLDKKIPVVTVCAAGKISLIAANLLQTQGYEAYSLEGGMKAWGFAWNTATILFQNFSIIQFRRTGKGCLSYMIMADKEAVVIDASLDISVYQNYLLKNKATLKYVIETHIHADHLSRSKQLAESNNATLHFPVPNKINFDFRPVDNDSIFFIGNVSIKTIQTPGHTLESTSYLIDSKVLFTGDTLFVNGVGRPDLKANNTETIQKSKLLYQSLQKIISLDDNIIVLPGHSSQPVDFDNIPIQATIAGIKKNVSLLQQGEKEFINTILQHIPETPANYLSIIEKNINGDFSHINMIDLESGANRCAVS